MKSDNKREREREKLLSVCCSVLFCSCENDLYCTTSTRSVSFLFFPIFLFPFLFYNKQFIFFFNFSFFFTAASFQFELVVNFDVGTDIYTDFLLACFRRGRKTEGGKKTRSIIDDFENEEGRNEVLLLFD